MEPLEKVCRVCGRARPASEDFCPYCTAPPPAPPPPRTRNSSSAVDTYLETRWGGGPDNPTVEEMRSALAELSVPDEEHPDTWLSDTDGWTVIVNETGLVIVTGEKNEMFRRVGVSREDALALWLLLQKGKRNEILTWLSV